MSIVGRLLSLACCLTITFVPAAEAQEPGTVETLFEHSIFGANFTLDQNDDFIISDQNLDQILRYHRATGDLEVLAGNGVRGFGGDGGPAVEAMLAAPSGLAFGPDGLLYFADQRNHRVRRINLATGIIDTVAGVGPDDTLQGAFSGDGGPAEEAELSRTGSVAFDSEDNMFIADVVNHRIRKVDVITGIITTFAGSGPVGFGNGTSTGDGGQAVEATLDRPQAVDFTAAGDVLIVESPSERWRIVSVETGIIDEFAGLGVAGFGGDGGPAVDALLDAPTGIAVDGADNVFMADQLNCRVRRIDAVTGTINTIAGDGSCESSGDGGPAEEARFDRPAKLKMNDAGDLFVAGRVGDGHGIRVIYGIGVPRADACDSDPASQGYWHRQCLGLPADDPDCPGIDPGRNGRGPKEPTESGFCPELHDCADVRLESLGFYGTKTCEGMDADTASDPCEKAEKQLTALILNVCSERLTEGCEVHVSPEGCSSTNVGDLINEVADLIHVGDCGAASACAGAVNEGDALVNGDGGGTADETFIEPRVTEPKDDRIDRSRRTGRRGKRAEKR